MFLRGKLFAETPIYRGNARKTLFTRDEDGTQRLVSLAGEISGTAQSLMDAFIGQSHDGRNIGLLNQLWQRLYDGPLPEDLIGEVTCKLQRESYPPDNFFDARMGIKLDEDRWAAEANANYKMETVSRNAVFDFTMTVNESILQKDDNAARLYYLLQELRESRFWFGAGKSKGLGRCQLEMELSFSAPKAPPAIRPGANHLRISLTFDALNPVLVGWNWGKVDPDVPEFAAVEGRLLVEAMRDLPDPIRERLKMVIGGPILSPEDWKTKLTQYMPRIVAIWLQEHSTGEGEVWSLPAKALKKLSKGRYKLAKSAVEAVEPLCEKSFPSREAAEEALVKALGDKANMASRILKVMEREQKVMQQLDREAWLQVAKSLGLNPALEERLAAQIGDEAALTKTLTDACVEILPQLYQQVDQQVRLLQSDTWVNEEVANREEHLQIKQLLLEGKITEQQWDDPNHPPEGVSVAGWQGFLSDHHRVKFQHMTAPRNLRKSIANDRNFIAFLKTYRDRTRQELAQPYHIDFRVGGPFGREVSRKYGKPYDTVFMRMLSWSPSSQEEGSWEIYIPGSTVKGAFRKRASQVLKTLWGESRRTAEVLDRLFGKQGQRGAVFFSDAYLTDPYELERAWCSMDGVRMNPQTGQPVEAAKHDYLFAYGEQLVFQLRLDIQDITTQDLDALSLLIHLLEDFQRGDIPLGGEKTSGFGWVEATIAEITWLTAASNDVTRTLFGDRELAQDGIWQRLTLKDEAAVNALQAITPLTVERSIQVPPRADAGFISHRSFGGHCGMLIVEAEVLTPIHVRESGEPSFRARLDDGPVNGWDFFSLAPPEAAMRPETRIYALPSRSIKGMLRHVYTIASDSTEPGTDLQRLNPADSLFGWVGRGPNQAIMGRLSVDFGLFDAPKMAWFKVPYPYTGWHCRADGQWKHTEGQATPQLQIDGQWRLFLHTPMAPIVKRLDEFQADTAQANYCRAILPGERACFTIRFWNLEDEEVQRLLWTVALRCRGVAHATTREPELAHKMGHHRYLGFGSLRLHILPQSFFIDWSRRYAGRAEQEWQLPIQVEEWLNPDVIAHYADLQRALNAESV